MMFRFTIADLGVFLNKSPVTLRAWERKGLIEIPREGPKRLMGVEDVRRIAEIALAHGRISKERWLSIESAAYYLEQVENE